MHRIYHTCSWHKSWERAVIHFPYHAVSGHFQNRTWASTMGDSSMITSDVMGAHWSRKSRDPAMTWALEASEPSIFSRVKIRTTHELFSYHVAKKPIVPL